MPRLLRVVIAAWSVLASLAALGGPSAGVARADAPSAPVQPVVVGPHATAAADTARARRLRGSGAYQRLMAQADSMLKLRGGSHAENAQLYLSWGAPWGMKGARTSLTPVCNDTTAIDTLYLSFYPGRSSDMFMGFSGELYFRTANSDSLGSWWHMQSKGGENGGNVLVEFGPSETMPGVQGWSASGQGFAQIDHTRDAMHLKLLYAVGIDDAVAIAPDKVYTLCRVLMRHRRATRLAGCGQPVCVEWVSGKFGFALKDEPEVRRGERFVTYGGGAKSCDAARGPRVPVWKPGAKK